jgi:hypothetical protein
MLMSSLAGYHLTAHTQLADKVKLCYDRWSVSLSWCQAPSGARNQIFVTVRQLRVFWCEAHSQMRGHIWHLQLLLVLTSAVILGSESHRTHYHILLPEIWDSPNLEGQVAIFMHPGTGFPIRHLRLAGLWWRYSITQTNMLESESMSVTLWLAVYQQSVLNAKPLETHDQYFFFLQMNTCVYSPYVISSLTRGWVCRLQLLLALASAVILGSESCGTRDHILISQIQVFPNLKG